MITFAMNMKKAFYLLLFPLLSLLFSCGSGNDGLSTDLVKNQNSAQGNTNSTEGPKFQFKEDVHDFGRLNQGEKVKFSFRFKNVGNADLIIASASASCGCTVADYPRTPIKPGAEGTIDVSFNSEGKKGFQHKTVTVLANTNPNSIQLSIKAQVVEL